MPGAAQVSVLLDALGHLLGRPDQVAGRPRLDRLAPERPRARLLELGFGLANEHLGRPGLADLVVVAPDVFAVALEQLAFRGVLVGLAAEVGAVGMAGDDPQRQLRPAAADPDRRVWILQRLGVAVRAGQRVVAALVRRLLVGPHRVHDLDALSKHPDAHLRLGELEAVAAVLVLVPAGTDAPVETAAADDVDGRGDLRQHARLAIRVAADHLAEADATRALADRRHRRPALEHGFVGGARDVVEVVVHPDRVVAELLGEHGDLDRLRPLRLGAVDRRQLHLPALGQERPEDHVAHVRTIGGVRRAGIRSAW